ncbi:hypothetical protein [Rossellomorea aquimaris]|uniref:hypothetical protein n=1 Tax=Rossellomorea aquimaris TaxID=189382 RepID=UPI0011E96EED|nr:hypothetical protein [Rossellomorea aquimaris]TYS88998.1 hypothetical protein FZC88_13115 [Rossellomorea aquimaris]
MDDKMLEKRMDLLNQSYKKIPDQTNPSDIIQAIKQEGKSQKKRPLIHWPYVASFIGVLLIGAVLILQLTMDGSGRQNGNQADFAGESDQRLQKEIEDAKAQYDLRKTQAMERLGFSEGIFNSTGIARDAGRQLTYIESIPKRDFSNERKVEWVQRASDELTQILTTPDVMMKNLKAPLTKEEAEVWVDDFIKKEQDILPLYEDELNKYGEYWKPYVENGEFNMKEFNHMKNDYPPKLWLLRDGIFNNAVKLSYNSETDRLETTLDVEYFRMITNREALPEGYELYMITRFVPVIKAGEFTGTWKEAADRLMDYEKILKELPDDSRFRVEVKHEYDLLYQYFTDGNVYQPIFNGSDKLKSHVEETYRYILKEYPDYTTSLHLKEVYDELRHENFVKPDRWVQTTPVILSSETEELYKER